MSDQTNKKMLSEILNRLESMPLPDIDRPGRMELESRKPLEWYYPEAKKNLKGTMRTRGFYRKGYPEGAIVHFTAGRGDPMADIENALANGYCYFVIAPDGTVYQNFSINKWGSHAGDSAWPGFDGWVSKYFVGIEICASGKLRKLENGKYRPWYNEAEYLQKYGMTPKDSDDLAAARVRYVVGKDNQKEGWYEKYTEQQEESLIKLLRWLYNNDPAVFSFDYVLGHDEVAPARKNDPGGALSMSMPEFREQLKSLT